MKHFRYIGWRFLAFVLLLGGLELYLRKFTTYGQLVVTERTERLGWRMVPSQSRWSREGDVPEVINSDGFRDREWDEPEEGEAVFRVAVLGQSMTYGTSVAIEETWPRVLEEKLRADFAARGDAREVLVMNFAVQGYTLEQMVRNHADNVAPFRPDVVIVPLHTGDVAPMPASADEFDFKYRRAWFRTATRDLLNREVVGKWMPRPAPIVDPNAPEPINYQHLLKTNPRDKRAQRLWAQAGGRMDELHRRVDADGGRLALVILPILADLLAPEREDPSAYWGPWASRRSEPSTVPLVKAREEFSQGQELLLRKLIERFGVVERLPLSPTGMRTIPRDVPGADDSLFLYQDVGHYSARGHRLLGEAVFEQLRAAGLWE